VYSKNDFKKGRKVVKLIAGAGTETATIREVAKCAPTKGLVYLDADDTTDDGPNTYKIVNGHVNVWQMPGFHSRIVPLEEEQ
jgi:hypothetical protein